MALFLIKATDATHADPVKDARGCYKRGDIVDVYEDSRHDGDLIANPIAAPFVLVRVSGVTVAQARAFLDPHRSDPLPCPRCGGTGLDPQLAGTCRRCEGRASIIVIVWCRLHHIDWDALPTAVKNALRDDRYYETTWAALRQYVKNKLTGDGA